MKILWHRVIWVWVILLLAIFNLICFTAAHAEAAELVNLDVIRQIESGGNPRAYNARSGAIGLYQITDICRRDYNQVTGGSVTRADLWDPVINHRISCWYINRRIPKLLQARGHAVTLDNVLVAYNAGISRVGKKLPIETVGYIKKYRKLS